MLVTAAVAAGQATVETAYDIPRISAALDYIHIMARVPIRARLKIFRANRAKSCTKNFVI